MVTSWSELELVISVLACRRGVGALLIREPEAVSRWARGWQTGAPRGNLALGELVEDCNMALPTHDAEIVARHLGLAGTGGSSIIWSSVWLFVRNRGASRAGLEPAAASAVEQVARHWFDSPPGSLTWDLVAAAPPDDWETRAFRGQGLEDFVLELERRDRVQNAHEELEDLLGGGAVSARNELLHRVGEALGIPLDILDEVGGN